MNKKEYLKTIKEPMRLIISRNKSYGDSFSYMRIESAVDLVMMKLSRIRGLGEEHVKTKDEIMDSINYLVMVLNLYNKKKEAKK